MSANIFHGSNVGGVRLYKSMDLFPMEKQKSMDKNSTVKFHGFTERTLNYEGRERIWKTVYISESL